MPGTPIPRGAELPQQPVAFSRQYPGGRMLVHEGLQPDDGAWIAGVAVEVEQ